MRTLFSAAYFQGAGTALEIETFPFSLVPQETIYPLTCLPDTHCVLKIIYQYTAGIKQQVEPVKIFFNHLWINVLVYLLGPNNLVGSKV